MAEATGLNPVAKLTEQGGDIYAVVDHIADQLDADEFVFVSVVHGDLYLAKWTEDEPYWFIDGEFEQGLTGSWDMETDKLAQKLNGTYSVIDVLGSHERYLVSTDDD